ncbi:MAG: TonB-dependent receptor [Pseudoxanthomonas sp.]
MVTGTRTSGRTVRNSASPIDLITPEDLKSTGADNLQDALRRLLPSLNLPAALQPDLGSISRGVQLRNLDPAYTLVLINGKRRNTTALVNEDGFAGSVAVDLALIPTGAVERVEVLRDGASAIYGSDAIAGVVNVILKNAPQGGSVSVKAGSTYKGDGDNRSFAADKGFALGNSGYLDLSVQYSQQDQAVRNSPLKRSWLTYPALDADGNYVSLGTNNSLPAGATANPAEATRDNRPWRNSGQIEAETTSAGFNAGYDFDSGLTLYGFGTYAHRRAYSAQNFRPAYTVWLNNPGLLEVYPDGFTPYQSTSEDQFQFVAGLKGAAAGWNWDLSSNYGQDIIDAYVQNSANYKLAYPGSQTSFYIGQRNYSSWVTNFDATRGIDVGWASSPLDVAAGVEFKHEHNQLKAGEPNSYYGGYGGGSVSLTGYFPQDASDTTRDSYAAYLGAGANITAAWFVDAAVRAEHYSDFGSSGVTGKLATRYEFDPRFAVRATLSNGFHAPSLVTTSYSNTSDRPSGVQSRLVRAGSPEALALGGDPLQPEKARNLSLGFGGQITSSINWAVDTYQIEVRHLLGSSSSIGIDWSSGVAVDPSNTVLTDEQIAIIESLLAQAGIPAGTSINVHYFTDVGDVRSRGVDLTLDGNHDLGPGAFRWSLAANFNKSDFTRISGIPEELQDLPNISTLSLSSQRNALYRAPRDKQILSLDYRVGPFSVNLRETRIGELRRFYTVSGVSGEYNAGNLYTTDLSLGWDFHNGLELTVAANNVFDMYPRRTPEYARSASSIAQYEYAFDNSGPLGNLGGTYYASLAWRF